MFTNYFKRCHIIFQSCFQLLFRSFFCHFFWFWLVDDCFFFSLWKFLSIHWLWRIGFFPIDGFQLKEASFDCEKLNWGKKFEMSTEINYFPFFSLKSDFAIDDRTIRRCEMKFIEKIFILSSQYIPIYRYLYMFTIGQRHEQTKEADTSSLHPYDELTMLSILTCSSMKKIRRERMKQKGINLFKFFNSAVCSFVKIILIIQCD